MRKLIPVMAGMALMLGMAATSALSQNDRFDHVVREKFFAGFSGDKAALDEAMQTCERVLAADPNHAEALVWHGSGLFQQAGEAFRAGDNPKGGQLFGRSMAEMERAVRLQPDNAGVRVPRGAVLLTGSRFMPAGQARPVLQAGLSDYEHVLNLQREYFDRIGTHPRGELLFGLAEGWNRAGDTEKATLYFQRIAKELPGTPYAKRAQKWLETKTLSTNETGCIGCHVPSKQ